MKAKQFKPAVRGKSDKFSWRVFQFLNYYKDVDIRVMRLGWNIVYGKVPLSKGQLYFVMDFDNGLPVTANVQRVTVTGKDAAGCCVSWGGLPFVDLESEDVTDWFFLNYARIGLCLWQGDWAHDFIKINKNSRKCKHCGEHQTRTIKTKRTIKRSEAWNATKAQ